MKSTFSQACALAVLLLTAACNSAETGKSRGPIVLGDSSSIVTETDPAALQDQVVDLTPNIKSTEEFDVPPAPSATDSSGGQHPASTATGPASAGAEGLTVPFKEVTISIPGIATRSYGKPDLQKARGASYELTGGKLAGTQLRVSGAAVTRVSQRTQSVLMLQEGEDKLVLSTLPPFTSGWQTLTSAGGAYPVAGLEPDKLEYKLPSSEILKNAVQVAARKARLDRKDTQDWLDAVHNLRSANTAPAVVMLRSAMWRVEGKGFSKELRVDIPLP